MEEEIKRGQILWVDFSSSDTDGHVQQGVRPALVLSNDKANKNSPVICVAAITSRFKKFLPVHVPIECKNNGLKLRSTCMLEQLKTIDKTAVIGYVDEISDDCLEKIDAALKIQLQLT